MSNKLERVWTGEVNYDDWLQEQEDAYKQGQQSCAAGPWVYRTDTGDETGKVVESAGFPKNQDKLYLLLTKGKDILILDSRYGDWIIKGSGSTVTIEWLQRNVIAFAEVKR